MSDYLQTHEPQHVRPPSLSITNSRSSPKPMSIESVMPSNHLILCHLLLLLPSMFPIIGVFSNESVLHIRWPKYWSFSFSISPSNEHPGLISFRIDWLDVLAVQGTLKSLLQHHSSKASILRHSAFITVQLSHPYMTTGKTIALTRQTFVGKVMSLLFNMLSRMVITFLPKSKRLLISWLQPPSAVILEPRKIKSATVSTVSPSICHEVMGPDAMIFVFWMLSFKPTFSLSSFNFIKRLFASSFSAIRLVSSAYLRLLIFPPAINQIRSVAQSCPTLCDPMNCSTPGLPVHHQLPEFPQTHVHRVSDAIQPTHPLSFPSPLAPNPSQHQSLFQWVNSSYEVAKVLEFQL